MDDRTLQARELRDVFGLFATGVTVVTCFGAGGPHGATVTAFCPISLEPPLCQVALARSARASDYLQDRAFAVNVLATHQVATALHFAGRPSATPPAWDELVGVPVLADALATIACTPWAQYDGGDHLIFLGEIVSASRRHDRAPLLFHGSAFRGLGEPVGHSAWLWSMDDSSNGWFDTAAPFTPFRSVTSPDRTRPEQKEHSK